MSDRVRGALRRDPLAAYLGLVVLGFVAFTLGPALLGRSTLISVHMLTGYLPWRADGLHDPTHQSCTGDTIDTVMPQIAYLREQWRSGSWGAWQGLVGGGSPTAAGSAVGLLNPLSLPYLVLPLWLAPVFVKLLEVAAAIGGTYLFLRRVGASRAAGLLAGLVFASSGFMVMWTNWPQTRVAALIPLLFWAVESLVQRPRPLGVAVLALVLASMLLGGFPAVTGYGLYFASLYLVVRLVLLHRHDLRRCVTVVVAAAGALVLAVTVAAVQLLPFLSFYSSQDFSYREAGRPRYLRLSTLLTVVDPAAHGLCTGTPYHGHFPIEGVTFLGAAAALLAVGGAVAGGRGHRVVARGVPSLLLACVVLTLLLGWGGSPLLHAASHLPVFAGNFVGRIRSLLGFLLAALAGIGFDALLRSRGRPSLRPDRSWLLPAVVWSATGVLSAVVLWQAYREARDGQYLADVRPTLWKPALVLVVTGAVCVVTLLGARYGRLVAALLLPLLVAAQSALFFHRVLPGDRPSDFYPVTGSHEFLRANLGEERFDSSSLVLYPSTSLFYGLRAATGHTFTDAQYAAMLEAADPGRARRHVTFSAFTRLLSVDVVGRNPLLDRLAVKYFAYGAPSVAGTPDPAGPAGEVVRATDGRPLTCTLPGGALRGFRVTLGAALAPRVPHDGVTVHATLRSGSQVLQAGRFSSGNVEAGQPFDVAVAGEDLPTGQPLTVELTSTGATAPLSLAGSGGSATCTALRPQDDHLRLAYADEAVTLYERLDALPRFRWASRSKVVPGDADQVTALAAGVERDTVVLEEQVPSQPGSTATVTVEDGSGDDLTATVRSSGAGFLTVADALQQPGWSVTVDGRSTRLLDADAGLAAVAVPGGTHRVRFAYTAPRQTLGYVVTGVGLLAVAGLVGLDLRVARRRRARPAAG